MSAPAPAPETPDQRKARQLADLRRLGELAMQLAELAHASARRQLAAPDGHAPDDTTPDDTTPVARDHAVTFASMARVVRQAIAIEIRLDAPARAPAAAERAARPAFRRAASPDPRRTLLRRVFADAVASDPDRAALVRDINAFIEQQIEADPDRNRTVPALVADLCDTFGIKLNLARVPDEILGMEPRRPYPAPS